MTFANRDPLAPEVKKDYQDHAVVTQENKETQVLQEDQDLQDVKDQLVVQDKRDPKETQDCQVKLDHQAPSDAQDYLENKAQPVHLVTKEHQERLEIVDVMDNQDCLLYTSPSPRDS